MRAGFGFFRVKLSTAKNFERGRCVQAVARGLLVAMLALGCFAGTSIAQTPAPIQDGKPHPPAKTRTPTKTQSPAKTRAPAKSRAPSKAKSPVPAKPATPAAPAPQPAPSPAPASPTGRAPVDVDVDRLQPYNLPPESRERMHQCGDEWRKLKMDGRSAGLTWRIFAEKCLPR